MCLVKTEISENRGETQADKGLEFEYKENTKLMNLQMFNLGSIIKDGLRLQMYKDEDSQISLH